MLMLPTQDKSSLGQKIKSRPHSKFYSPTADFGWTQAQETKLDG